MAEPNPVGNGCGENREMVMEMGSLDTQPDENGKDLGLQGTLLARALDEVGTTECLTLSVLVVSLITLVYVILLIILFSTGII